MEDRGFLCPIDEFIKLAGWGDKIIASYGVIHREFQVNGTKSTVMDSGSGLYKFKGDSLAHHSRW